MREGKMLLIEKGHIVVIRESAEMGVSFGTLEEFMKYIPELNVSRCSDYYYLDYEPERKIHFYNLQTDKPHAELKKGPIPDKVLDDIINNFSLIKQRKDDSFWGMPLDKAKEIGINLKENQTLSDIRKLSSEIDYWKYEVGLLTNKQSRNNQIKDLLSQDDNIKQQIKAAKTVNKIKELLK